MEQAILALLVDGKWRNTHDIRKSVTGRNTSVADALAIMVGEGLIQVRIIGTEKQFRISEPDIAQGNFKSYSLGHKFGDGVA
jgi:hypothetical protein